MAEHSIRPREDWLDPAGPPWDHCINGKGVFYVCPPFRGWDDVGEVVIHYPGADWADMDINNDNSVDEFDTISLLRSGHRTYLMGSRGYSYGYGFVIGTGGDTWEVRGYEYANAANLGDSAHGTNPPPWNNSTISIQVVVDEAKPMSLEQMASLNWLLDDMVRHAGHSLGLTYHRDGQSTACPGDGIVSQIESGWIGFGKSQPTPPSTGGPVAGKAGTTLFIPIDCDAQFIGQTDDNGVATDVWWADAQRANAHLGAGARIDDQLSLGGFSNVVLLGPLPVGDARHTWTGSEFFRVVT